jgi:hypothetical protein
VSTQTSMKNSKALVTPLKYQNYEQRTKKSCL